MSYETTTFDSNRFGYRNYVHANATWTYSGGDWRGVCTADVREYSSTRDEWNNRTETRTYSAASPPHWPIMNTRDPPPVGGEVDAWLFDECELIKAFRAAYDGTETETLTLNGAAVVVPTHRAVHHPESSNQALRTEWSQESGLVVNWVFEWWGSVSHHTHRGRLVSTDAPLR